MSVNKSIAQRRYSLNEIESMRLSIQTIRRPAYSDGVSGYGYYSGNPEKHQQVENLLVEELLRTYMIGGVSAQELQLKAKEKLDADEAVYQKAQKEREEKAKVLLAMG